MTRMVIKNEEKDKPEGWSYGDIVRWYSRIDVKFEISKQLFKRETALLVPKFVDDDEMSRSSVRMLKVHNTNHLDVNLRAVRMFERRVPYNFYYSLARYENGIPNQHLNFAKRDNSGWNVIHHEEISWFDMLIDIDCDRHEDIPYCKLSMIEIVNLFDDLNVPYSVRFSGCGFHIIIPGEHFLQTHGIVFNPKSEDNIYKLYSRIARYLYDRYSELIDMSIYDSRRIVKVPYSLAVYKDELYVCSPLNTWDEIKDFVLSDYILRNYSEDIRGRGVKIFNPDGDINKLLEVVNG